MRPWEGCQSQQTILTLKNNTLTQYMEASCFQDFGLNAMAILLFTSREGFLPLQHSIPLTLFQEVLLHAEGLAVKCLHQEPVRSVRGNSAKGHKPKPKGKASLLKNNQNFRKKKEISVMHFHNATNKSSYVTSY